MLTAVVVWMRDLAKSSFTRSRSGQSWGVRLAFNVFPCVAYSFLTGSLLSHSLHCSNHKKQLMRQ